MRAFELLNDTLYALRRTDTVATARAFMAEQGVTELPILDKQELYNYVRSIMLAEYNSDQKLEDVIAFNPLAPRISENSHLYEMVPVFAASDLQVLAVVNDNHEFVGIVDQKSLHKQISQSLTYKGIGAVILLKVEPSDFAPSQIARLVEENGAKVLGMMVNHNEDGSLELSLKINTTIVKGIVATFQRFNYKVVNCYMSEDYNKGSEKEYDSVLRFFNI
jgi:predicted transcriptional regulator